MAFYTVTITTDPVKVPDGSRLKIQAKSAKQAAQKVFNDYYPYQYPTSESRRRISGSFDRSKVIQYVRIHVKPYSGSPPSTYEWGRKPRKKKK